jgi:hypothetical protein
MNDRETDLSKRLEKAHKDLAAQQYRDLQLLADRDDKILRLEREIARQWAYLKTISWIALGNGVISRGVFAAANNINREDIDDFLKAMEESHPDKETI